MENKGRYKDRKFGNDLDDDFDLDSYIEEQSSDSGSLWNDSTQAPHRENPETYRKKNFLLIAAIVFASVLWVFDWSVPDMWNSFFGSDEVATTQAAPDININIPEIPAIPAIPSIPGAPTITQDVQTPPPLEMSLTEYLSELNDLGYLDDKLSAFSARQLYDSNIPVSYLQQLDEAGYLEDLSFVYITNYFTNNIPLSYLDQLRDAGIYEELSFVDVNSYYQNEIPIDYLEQLNEAGYLEELSFVYVTNYYQNGITTEFLDQLKESGLYDNLSFLDVIDIYQRENPTQDQ